MMDISHCASILQYTDDFNINELSKLDFNLDFKAYH